MKQIIVSTMVDKPFVGIVSGIRLDPVESSTSVKLVALSSPHNITLAIFADQAEAMGVFYSCQQVILDPTINPVVLNFTSKPIMTKETRETKDTKLKPPMLPKDELQGV